MFLCATIVQSFKVFTSIFKFQILDKNTFFSFPFSTYAFPSLADSSVEVIDKVANLCSFLNCVTIFGVEYTVQQYWDTCSTSRGVSYFFGERGIFAGASCIFFLSCTLVLPVLEFLNNIWGLGTEQKQGCRTGPPGYTVHSLAEQVPWERFLGSLKV